MPEVARQRIQPDVLHGAELSAEAALSDGDFFRRRDGREVGKRPDLARAHRPIPTATNHLAQSVHDGTRVTG